MPRRLLGSALLAVAALAISGCGGGDATGQAAATVADWPGPSANEGPPVSSTTGQRQDRAKIAECRGGVTLPDGTADSRSWTSPNTAPPAPPSGDLLRFALRATAKSVCARFETADTLLVGTELSLVMRTPMTRQPGGARIAHGYGFSVVLDARGGGIATYGKDRRGSDDPRVLKANVTWAGNAASVVIPRAELDRPPVNMPERPAFPFREFTFLATLITPPAGDGSQSVDHVPPERTKDNVSGQAGYVNGRLRPSPCELPEQ